MDQRSDVYSLGVRTLRDVGGHGPAWPRASWPARFTDPLPEPSSLCEDVPPWLDTVLARALAARPDDRFPHGRPPSARPSRLPKTFSPRPAAPRPRARLLWMAAGAAAMALDRRCAGLPAWPAESGATAARRRRSRVREYRPETPGSHRSGTSPSTTSPAGSRLPGSCTMSTTHARPPGRRASPCASGSPPAECWRNGWAPARYLVAATIARATVSISRPSSWTRSAGSSSSPWRRSWDHCASRRASWKACASA